MPTCLVGLGANLGPRQATLRHALQAIEQLAGIRVTAHSPPRETQAVGGPEDQGPYLNAAITLETEDTASVLLQRLLEIEGKLGRMRSVHWGPRVIDIDLLLHGQTVVETAALTVPHPWLAVRRFVLESAVEIAPHLQHPLFGYTIQQLWEHLLQGSRYLAVTGGDLRLVTHAVRKAAASCAGQTLWDPVASPGVGVTGIDFETALLRQRFHRIREFCQNVDRRPLISNFWTMDALASGALAGPSDAVADLMERVHETQNDLWMPWLVVLIERAARDGSTSDAGGKATGGTKRRLDAGRLRELVTQSARGPWLKLRVSTAAQAARLLIAAIHSRGPQLPQP